jgi:hypothetical protein
MAGITKREREDKARIEDIKAKLRDNPKMALHLYQRLNSSLTALQRVQDRRVAARAAITAARRIARQAATRPHINVLPENFRGPPRDWKPATVKPFELPPGINAD